MPGLGYLEAAAHTINRQRDFIMVVGVKGILLRYIPDTGPRDIKVIPWAELESVGVNPILHKFHQMCEEIARHHHQPKEEDYTMNHDEGYGGLASMTAEPSAAEKRHGSGYDDHGINFGVNIDNPPKEPVQGRKPGLPDFEADRAAMKQVQEAVRALNDRLAEAADRGIEVGITVENFQVGRADIPRVYASGKRRVG